MDIPPLIPQGSPPPIPQSPSPTKPKEKFTAAGIVLVLATIAATIFGGIFCVFWLFPKVLPEGHYPILLLAVPIVGCGVVVAAGGTWICKFLRVSITVPIDHKPDDDCVA